MGRGEGSRFVLAMLLSLSIAGAAGALERVWIGPQYWANPLQDWRRTGKRIECVTSGGNRNVYLLTHELIDNGGSFEMSVKIGSLGAEKGDLDAGWVGFRVGVKGQFNDYRDSAVRGVGMPLGITTDGRLFINTVDGAVEPLAGQLNGITLRVSAERNGLKYRVNLRALLDNVILAQVWRDDIEPQWLSGGVAIVCSTNKVPATAEAKASTDKGHWWDSPATTRGGNVRFWFEDWRISGSKVKVSDERQYGPVLFAQHTLSRGVMKMTAQMPPIGSGESQTVELQTRGRWFWKTISKAKVDAMARTATFRVKDWDSSVDTPYRILYRMTEPNGRVSKRYFEGTVRHEPKTKREIVVAGFTGNNDLGFPNNDIVDHVRYHNPDLLFFSGDQIYESVGGYGVQREPIDKATLDYLRKWYIFGWTYRDLMRDIPSVSIPDDHDVYHGNLWGESGKATTPGLQGAEAQDTGGYKMPPAWVNMVQRTQTSHLPDPYDPTRVEQGITVYYTSMNYGGISFAIIEDRKFKSAPKPLLPDADIYNGWPRNPDFNAAASADVPGAILLGERQLNFLDEWAIDYSGGTWMKVVLSQTIFADVATLPADEMTDAAVPKLRILKAGEYPPDDKPVCDMDSDGWPQTGRNKALRAIRRGFAFHIAGDQHLGSMIQYGLDHWHDAGYAFCVPAVSNIWPRRWYPSEAGANRRPGAPKYTGDFRDGFGNRVSVYAVSNPIYTGLKPSMLYDRATGYGIVRFDRQSRDVTVECWPRLADPADPQARQYPGWPFIFNQLDDYIEAAPYYLPRISVSTPNAVIEVTDERTSEILYCVRIAGESIRPKVYRPGKYTIRVVAPTGDQSHTLTGINTIPGDDDATIGIDF